ncbi:MAG: hypothetical protein CMG64_06440 [Candidatus Marinimicrobia bacterium]|nr:hypothetical protein [Candidatus Neomarinimicrobiota bacterium]
MRYILSTIIGISIILGNLFSSVTESNTGWSYLQSDQQTFYIFIDYISIIDQSGNTIDGYGDGSGTTNSSGDEDCMQDPSSCDVLGAFITHQIPESECLNVAEGTYQDGQCEVCVGWIYYNSYSPTTSGAIATTLPIMGQTSSQDPIYDYYCGNNESPHLKFHDSSDGITYSLTSETDLGVFFNNNIFVYYPDCSDVGAGCEEIMFTAETSQNLDNDDNSHIPDSFEIISIYPNPFNPSTNISYTLNIIDNISITVFDTLGNEIETLFDGYQGIGVHKISWNPGAQIPSGNYFIKINTSNNHLINKVTYIK